MVVVLIISLLMGAVAFVAWRQWGEAQKRITAQTVQRVQLAVEQFAMERGNRCPEELAELAEVRILTGIPADAWDAQLGYRCPSEQGSDLADVWSRGPDGLEGTDDDICSWKLAEALRPPPRETPRGERRARAP